MNVKMIIDLEDSVIGSMHQIVVEDSDSAECIQVDGSTLPQDHPFNKEVFAFLLAWEDHFEGIVDKQEYLLEMQLKELRRGNP